MLLRRGIGRFPVEIGKGRFAKEQEHLKHVVFCGNDAVSDETPSVHRDPALRVTATRHGGRREV